MGIAWNKESAVEPGPVFQFSPQRSHSTARLLIEISAPGQRLGTALVSMNWASQSESISPAGSSEVSWKKTPDVVEC